MSKIKLDIVKEKYDEALDDIVNELVEDDPSNDDICEFIDDDYESEHGAAYIRICQIDFVPSKIMEELDPIAFSEYGSEIVERKREEAREDDTNQGQAIENALGEFRITAARRRELLEEFDEADLW